MVKLNLNKINLKKDIHGYERRVQMLQTITRNSTLTPNTILFKDIDESFKEWVDKDLRIIDNDGKIFPTMPLFSNQRFSEYAQSWSFTDSNNNLLLNFKTVNRENNPQFGKIQHGLWNIPGDRFYTLKRLKVLDNNGTESLLNISMKQPTAIDFNYKVTIFTTTYSLLNTFNTIVNKRFNSRQCYIRVNGHYMPMVLDNITDESEYNIDDRQFYSQTFVIKLHGYIITEDDYKIEEIPLRKTVKNINTFKNKTDVELEEKNNTNLNSKDISIKVSFPKLKNRVNFTLDTTFIFDEIKNINITNNYKIFINGKEIKLQKGIKLYDNDYIEIEIHKRNPLKESEILLNGHILT